MSEPLTGKTYFKHRPDHNPGYSWQIDPTDTHMDAHTHARMRMHIHTQTQTHMRIHTHKHKQALFSFNRKMSRLKMVSKYKGGNFPFLSQIPKSICNMEYYTPYKLNLLHDKGHTFVRRVIYHRNDGCSRTYQCLKLRNLMR